MMNEKFLIWDSPKQAVWHTMFALLFVGCINILVPALLEQKQMVAALSII